MTFADQSIESFLDRVASEALTPSAGAVAAVTGASGAALCEMVCLHTLGDETDGDGETELVETGETLQTLRGKLLALADADAAAVEGVRSVFAESADEQSVDEVARRATEVPLETAEVCLAILEHAEVVAANGTRNATADAVTGAVLAHAALQSSLGLVRANLPLLDSGQFHSQTVDRVDELEHAGQQALERARTAAQQRG